MDTRLLKLKTLIKKQHLDVLLISSVSNITYLTEFSNFSKDEREAYLLITLNKQYIFTDGRYSEAVYEKVKGFELLQISSENTFTELLLKIIKDNKIKQIGFEPQNLSVSEFINFKKKLKPLRLVPTKQLVEQIRVIKESNEIDKIENACKIGDKAFDYILGKIKEGITEKELAFELELYIKKQGADISFPSIVAFGRNSSVPHHQTGNQRLTSSGQFVLLDFGVKLNNYCSDMTRTVFFGKASKEQKRVYQTVLDAQKRTLDYLRKVEPFGKVTPLCKGVDKIARDYIASQGYPTIPHSLGHGIGLEVHESPRLSPKSKDILKPGMIFSIEPGIYLKGIGGVRIEDLAVLTKRDVYFLTNSSKDIIEL